MRQSLRTSRFRCSRSTNIGKASLEETLTIQRRVFNGSLEDEFFAAFVVEPVELPLGLFHEPVELESDKDLEEEE